METPRENLNLEGECGAFVSVRSDEVSFGGTTGEGFTGCIFFVVVMLLVGERHELALSGLVLGEPLAEFTADSGVLSGPGRGESGTFHKLASSGRSSSKSSYSSSSSFTDFLLGCQDPLLTGALFISGDKDWGRGDKRGGAGWSKVGLAVCEGDGDRDRLKLLIAVIANDGAEGLVNPLFEVCPRGKMREFMGARRPMLFACVCKCGYGGFWLPFVSSLLCVVASALFMPPFITMNGLLNGRRLLS